MEKLKSFLSALGAILVAVVTLKFLFSRKPTGGDESVTRTEEHAETLDEQFQTLESQREDIRNEEPSKTDVTSDKFWKDRLD